MAELSQASGATMNYKLFELKLYKMFVKLYITFLNKTK